jgi:cyclic pyranopterin phosphate synthase
MDDTDMSDLTHLDEEGNARMVDVTGKKITEREARAEATVRMSPAAYQALKAGTLKKGDALNVARLAGIIAAKRTDELIPLCHTLPLSGVSVDFSMDDETHSGHIISAARVTARTGVEMEALTAASVAALTIYDMCKAIDKGIVIERIQLLEKRGGKSGEYRNAR